MKSLSPIVSGVRVSVTDILKKQYPDIDFDIKHDASKDLTVLTLKTKAVDGSTAVCRLGITAVMMESHPDALKHYIEDGVRKLREYVGRTEIERENENNNPSSRWYGKWTSLSGS